MTDNFDTNKTILVAEDEETNFLFIKEALRKTSFSLIWTKNGEEAVDKVMSDIPIDLVLMDIKMPIMNGYTAITKIQEYAPAIPIIAQTAYSIEENRQDFFAKQNVGYIQKPFRRKDLIAKIEEMLNKSATK